MNKKLFLASNYNWSFSGLEKCITDNKLKSRILIGDNNGAIVHVTSYNDSVILGAESDWCISQHKCSWEQYVTKPNGVQLFFFCFNEYPHGNKSLYGATFVIEKGDVKTSCCFTRDNNPISKVEGFKTDGEALFNVVINPIFGNIKEELKRTIFALAKKDVSIIPETAKKKEDEDYCFIPSFLSQPKVDHSYYQYDDDEYYDSCLEQSELFTATESLYDYWRECM